MTQEDGGVFGPHFEDQVHIVDQLVLLLPNVAGAVDMVLDVVGFPLQTGGALLIQAHVTIFRVHVKIIEICATQKWCVVSSSGGQGDRQTNEKGAVVT